MKGRRGKKGAKGRSILGILNKMIRIFSHLRYGYGSFKCLGIFEHAYAKLLWRMKRSKRSFKKSCYICRHFYLGFRLLDKDNDKCVSKKELYAYCGRYGLPGCIFNGLVARIIPNFYTTKISVLANHCGSFFNDFYGALFKSFGRSKHYWRKRYSLYGRHRRTYRPRGKKPIGKKKVGPK